MGADEHNTLMILSPVCTPARIAAPSDEHRANRQEKKTKQMEECNKNWEIRKKTQAHGRFVDISAEWM